jgi:hypothetical protein
MNRFSLLAICVIAFLETASLAQEIPLQTALTAHESAQSLIERLDFTLNYSHSFRGNAPTDQQTVRFSRDLAKERVQQHGGTQDGQLTNFRDIFSDQGTSYQLFGWKPGEAKRLAIGDQRGVSGQIKPRTLSPLAVDPLNLLLLTFPYFPSGTRQTLSELVKTAAQTEWQGTIRKKSDLLRLRAYWPGINGGRPDGSYFDVYLDPSVNFLVRRRVMRLQTYPGENKGVSWTPYESVGQVIKFANLGDGVFFPTEIEYTTQDIGAPEPRTKMSGEVSGLVINEPLPKDAFDFSFPENLVVHHSSGGRTKMELWGPDNKPKLEIKGAQHLASLIASNTPRHPYPAWVWLLCINATLLAVSLGALIIFRRRKR